MFLGTGITNFAGLPIVVQFYRKKQFYNVMIGLMTFVSSFMYHTMDSVDREDMFLSINEWHRIDNIGSICCFIMLAIYLMDNKNPNLDLALNLIGLMITLLCQEKAPWEIEYTAFPIALFGTLWILTAFCFRPRKTIYIKKMLAKGVVCFAFAVFGFVKGLDEFEDYLRLHHGMWHFLCGIASFYVWQCISGTGEELTWTDLFTKPVTFATYDSVPA